MVGGPEQETFYDERRRVLLGMAAAAAVTFSVAIAVWLVPASITLDGSLMGRLRLGASMGLLPAGIVAILVGRIAVRRFQSPDLLAGAAIDRPESALAVDKAVLSNSIEQAAMAVSAYLLLALVLPVEQLLAVPALAALFVIGRMRFAVRYKAGAAARSFGFALTFFPTVAGMLSGVALAIM